MSSEPMEIDDEGKPVVANLDMETNTSGSSSTELNDSDTTSLISEFCPHCNKSLSPFSQNVTSTHPPSLAVAHAEWSEVKANLNDALHNKFNKGFYAVV